jgi:hypothetical protein
MTNKKRSGRKPFFFIILLIFDYEYYPDKVHFSLLLKKVLSILFERTFCIGLFFYKTDCGPATWCKLKR